MESSSSLHTDPTLYHSLSWWPSFLLSLPYPLFCFHFSQFSKRVISAIFYIQSFQNPFLLAASLLIFRRFADSTSTVFTLQKVFKLLKMLPCANISDNICKIGNRCLESLGLRAKPRPKLEISSPFDFKEGPAVHFPGYSEDDISLMREKAIASTAIVEAEDGDLEQFEQYEPSRRDGARSRASSHSCGLRGRVISHARRVSRGQLH